MEVLVLHPRESFLEAFAYAFREAFPDRHSLFGGTSINKAARHLKMSNPTFYFIEESLYDEGMIKRMKQNKHYKCVILSSRITQLPVLELKKASINVWLHDKAHLVNAFKIIMQENALNGLKQPMTIA